MPGIKIYIEQANPGDLVAATWKQPSAFAEQSR